MTKRIFITATNTDIGKTYTTLKLMEYYASLNYSVGVIKPIETGVSTSAPDATLLLEMLKSINHKAADFNIDDIAPLQFSLPAAPFVAKGTQEIEWRKIEIALTKMESICDICLIEGAGGLFVPIDEKSFIIDLIVKLKAKTLLVTHSKLGCINDTLLSLEALKSRDIEHCFAINCRNYSDFNLLSKPYFEHAFSRYFDIEIDIKELCKELLL